MLGFQNYECNVSWRHQIVNLFFLFPHLFSVLNFTLLKCFFFKKQIPFSFWLTVIPKWSTWVQLGFSVGVLSFPPRNAELEILRFLICNLQLHVIGCRLYWDFSDIVHPGFIWNLPYLAEEPVGEDLETWGGGLPLLQWVHGCFPFSSRKEKSYIREMLLSSCSHDLIIPLLAWLSTCFVSAAVSLRCREEDGEVFSRIMVGVRD